MADTEQPDVGGDGLLLAKELRRGTQLFGDPPAPAVDVDRGVFAVVIGFDLGTISRS